MPKRSSTVKKQARAGGTLDDRSVSNAPQKNPAAVALGRLGGLKGGRARAEKLSPKKRSQIAKRAAQARWGSL